VLLYSFKRVLRGWRLFLALTLGMLIASTFFTGINVGADTVARQSLEQTLQQQPVDAVVSTRNTKITAQNATDIRDLTFTVVDVTGAELISRTSGGVVLSGDNTTTTFTLVAIPETSLVRNGMERQWGPGTLGANETFVDLSSKDALRLRSGEVFTYNITISSSPKRVVSLNLTVTGFVTLTDEAFYVSIGRYMPSRAVIFGGGAPQRRPQQNLLVTSWETLAGVMDLSYNQSAPTSPITTDVLIKLNRAGLVDPWDVSGSIDQLQTVTSQISNKVAPYGLSANNYLVSVLNQYQIKSITMRTSFVVMALPVFFMAWYLGTTVAGVSFNLRRREIGLLLTKGLSRRQLLIMFLGEAIFIGVFSGFVGVALGVALDPLLTGRWTSLLSTPPAVNLETMGLAVVFTVAMALLSVFRPALKASNLSAVDALREYAYPEEPRSHRRLWTWLALALGAYKVLILLLGLDLQSMVPTGPSRNLFVFILLRIGIFLDGVLSYIGPILFFWGFTRIFVQGSLRFNEGLAKIGGALFGDLVGLAVKNIRRNVSRVVPVAFLAALIMGYGVSVVGDIASQQDLARRTIYSTVGADLSISLFSPVNASSVLIDIRNMSGIESATIEYSFSGQTSLGSVSLRAVNASEWLTTAYYEGEWFAGSGVDSAFEPFGTDNKTVILDRQIARNLNLGIGDHVTLSFGGKPSSLRITGLFGAETPSQTSMPGVTEVMRLSPRYWSYIPVSLYSQVNSTVSASTRILVKLTPGADGEAMASDIQDLRPEIQSVDSVAEQMRLREQNVILTGPVNVQKQGVVFAGLAASIGIILVTYVTLQERRREMSLMRVRGLSFGQMTLTLLSESSGIIGFSIALGALVGYITTRGNAASYNISALLVLRRVVFPLDSLYIVTGVCLLLIGSMVLPVILASLRSMSKPQLRG